MKSFSGFLKVFFSVTGTCSRVTKRYPCKQAHINSWIISISVDRDNVCLKITLVQMVALIVTLEFRYLQQWHQSASACILFYFIELLKKKESAVTTSFSCIINNSSQCVTVQSEQEGQLLPFCLNISSVKPFLSPNLKWVTRTCPKLALSLIRVRVCARVCVLTLLFYTVTSAAFTTAALILLPLLLLLLPLLLLLLLYNCYYYYCYY